MEHAILNYCCGVSIIPISQLILNFYFLQEFYYLAINVQVNPIGIALVIAISILAVRSLVNTGAHASSVVHDNGAMPRTATTSGYCAKDAC